MSEDGALLEGNPAFLRLLGVDAIAPATQTLEPYFQPEDYAQLLSQLQQNGQIRDREFQLHRVDGNTIWVQVSKTFNTIDGVTVIDGLMEDISKVKQRETECQEALEELAVAEEELKTQNEELARQNEDLSQQKEALVVARQTVEAERQRYQELFEFAPDSYLVTDAAATILEANRAAASMLGVQSHLLIGLPFLNFVADSDRQELVAKINEPRSGDWVREWEVRIVRQWDRRPIDVILTVAVVRDCAFLNAGGDRKGQFVALRWLIRDITQRKQALTALQASETRFRQLAESIEDVFWMCDPQQARSLYVSSAYEKIWGRSCASLKANWQEWIDTIYPDDRERVREAFFTNILRGKYDEEYRIVRPDGTVRWVRDRGYPVKNDAGEIQCVNGIAEDITERKQIAAELHRREQEFRALVENSLDIISRFNLELRHLYVNPAIEQATGIPQAHFLGKTNAELGFATETATAWDNSLREVLTTRQCSFLEFDFSSPDGTRSYQSRIAPEFAQDSSAQSLLAISRDVTEYKLAEKALRERSERLKLLSETASALLSTEQPLALMNDLFEKLAAQLDLHFYFNFLVDERDRQQMWFCCKN
ncbi:PAS domain-containing protein [Gloeocapsopsis dulcis]|uniref:histidine kinase n=1 Tax=Gloeocapsopsis dulcis AAB1 = 1H9 TaxID=1433147 RepID=A0A6N8FT50_9CHRO|nr:PAS domain S-box protein [Gloeocapsopsis dulcis]MUL35742.1 hypothetical protein [Gloeocapsopsis dulcis AAB1 = 1H9]WNN90973.1 PAS domain S-box protein [Gloeocapsopsis dulcis]